MSRIPNKIEQDALHKPVNVRLSKKACRKLERVYRKLLHKGERPSYQKIITDLILQHL